ncbi:MAG: glycosyltransferase family 4 protein [candidate division WS1 bacterium]|nr:glycosyltransferase family 4 protein [candidate division WS1 bacterium]
MPGNTERISVCHVLEATAGGTRQYLMDACLGLPTDRFEQTAIVSTRRDERFVADIEALRAAGVRVEVVEMVREIDRREDLRAFRELRDHFRANRYDIIHTHSSKAGMLGRLAAWRAHNPAARVYSPHAFAFEMRVTPSRAFLYHWLERLAGRITDLLICTCDSEREIAVRRRIVPPSRAAVVRTGVDLRRFHPQPDALRVREEIGLPPRHRIVGTVGGLVEQKGHRDLLHAAALVLAELPHTTFVIAGSGDLEDELRGGAEALGLGRRVRFLGARDDIPRLLAGLDLFVMPSLWEGMPYALIEAMAVGVPVLGSAIPGIVDLIVPNRTGWLAPPAAPEELAEGIVRALRQEGQSAAMAQAARDMVVREHSRERMLSSLANCYERLIEVRAQ